MLPLARFAIARPRAVLLLFLAATAAVVPGLLRLDLRTDGAAIYPAGDPVVRATLADRETFQETDQVILLATAHRRGPLLASPAGFRFLHAIVAPLQALPGLRPYGVRSLATLLDPPARDGEPLHAFLDRIPDGGPAFASLLARIYRTPPASGLFLSKDGTAAAVYLLLEKGAARRPLIDRLERWVAASRAPFELRVTGPVAAEAVLGEAVLADLERLVPAMVAAVALLLALTLGTPAGVLIPLAQVLATLAWTLGLMGWLGVPVTLVTTVMPVLLMAMAMTDEIYLLERVEGYLAAGREGAAGGALDPDRSAVRRAAAAAFAELATPLVLISATTAAGFLSFAGDAIAPIRHLGLFTGLGLLLGMLFTFTLAPALIATLPPRWLTRRRRSATPEPVAHEHLLARRPRAAAGVVVALAALAIPGLFCLRVQDSWIDNFDPRSPLVTAERAFNREFWGSYRFDVVLAGVSGLFWTPEGVGLMEGLDRLARQAPAVGGVLSLVPPFELAARLRGGAPPVSALPAAEVDRVGAYVEIVQKWIDLRDILTAGADRARARLFLRDADYAKGRALAAYLERRLPPLLARLPAGRRAAVHFSGDVPVALAVVGGIVRDQLRSIGWTAALVALLLLAALRHPRLAAAILAPVLVATLLLFAALGYAGVPLGIATSMFAALNLGAGVDFAVQYAYAYRRARRAGLDHDPAIRETLATTGRGLRWNALVLALGIAVLGLSGLKPNRSLGLLLAAAIAVSYAATVALLPELLRWTGRRAVEVTESRWNAKGGGRSPGPPPW